MSPELRAELNKWLAWVERGAPEEEPYFRSDSLCWALIGHEAELKELFIAQGLSTAYPFGGEDRFDSDLETSTMHENPLRLDWVRNVLGLPQPPPTMKGD